jgi:hypothetical protein
MKHDLIDELSAFKKTDESGDLRTAFWAVSADQLTQFETKTGVTLPPELRTFYEQVGHGRIQLSRNGKWAEFDLNIIVEPARLTSLFLRADPSFEVDAELVEDGDLPFFDMGSHSYLVMRPNSAAPDAIYWPYDPVPISKDIWDFSNRLLTDPRFYHKNEEKGKGGSPHY